MLVEPLHVKLKQALIAGITAGTYPAGDRIPSERELCEQFRKRFKGRKFPDSADLIREDRDR